MSSVMRNAVKRRTHKERSTPSFIPHGGMLERRKDYVERSRDYNRKKEVIRSLRRKASFKSNDEFYFGMVRARTRDGVHTVTQDGTLDQDTVTALKGQDVAYLRHRKAGDDKRADRLRSELHGLRNPAKNTRTLFVDSAEAAETARPPRGGPAAPPSREGGKGALKRRDRLREQAYKELAERERRSLRLSVAISHLEAQRKAASKGAKRRVSGGENGVPAVYKWRRERQR